METGDIIEIFAQSGFQIDPQALDYIKTSPPERINDFLKSIDESVLVVRIEHLKSKTAGIKIPPFPEIEIPLKVPLTPGKVDQFRIPAAGFTKRNPIEGHVTILKDITNQSTCIGEYTEFVQYFRDRYDSLERMLRKRLSARPIESLKKWNLDTRESFL